MRYLFRKPTNTNDPGYDSGYESDNGTYYQSRGDLGKGKFAKARRFVPVGQEESNKDRVVLSPSSARNYICYSEVFTKYAFFKKMYPDSYVKLIRADDTYRLILPYIPGKTYQELMFRDENKILKLFYSAIQALQKAHAKKIVFLDLKEDNIKFDAVTGISYLIDGGSAVKLGECMLSPFFLCENEEAVQRNRNNKNYTQLAPECWSTSRENRATEKMDIYSLASMFKQKFSHSAPSLMPLLDSCLDRSPENRPSLGALNTQTIELMNPLVKNINNLSFSDTLTRLDFIINLKNHSLDAPYRKFILQLLEKFDDEDTNTQNEALEALKSIRLHIKKPIFQEEIINWIFKTLPNIRPEPLLEPPFFSWICGVPDATDVQPHILFSVLPIIRPYLSDKNEERIYFYLINMDDEALAVKVTSAFTLDYVPLKKTRIKLSDEYLNVVVFRSNSTVREQFILNVLSSLNKPNHSQSALSLLCFFILECNDLYRLIKYHVEKQPSDTVGRCQLNFFMDTYACTYDNHAEKSPEVIFTPNVIEL
ncbi:MAG: hypothetical protein QNK11_00490 [Legionella sp.]|nr:hypothetical protein [Legionella sp.]